MPVNQYERALRAWPLLTTRTPEELKVTYSELADHLGIHVRPIRYVLAVIQDWCLAEKKPPLTILVVNQGQGRQGQGFIAWDPSDIEEGFRAAFAYPWLNLPNPFAFASQDATPEDLAGTIIGRPREADRYGPHNRAGARRAARQASFRRAL